MKIALALILPLMATLGCGGAPAAPPATPTPTPQPGATFHIPPQPPPTATPTPSVAAPAARPTVNPPRQSTPAPSAISQDDEISQDQSLPDNDNETPIHPSPTPARKSDPAAPTATPPSPDSQIATDKPLPPRSSAQFKRNPPIGALSSALSRLARDAAKPDADLAALANSMPISNNESVAVTAYGDFGDDYPALRQSLIKIGADIRNEDESSYIEMYIPVASLIALANLSDNIHRIDPIIPPSAN